jgi:hypothetical protein
MERYLFELTDNFTFACIQLYEKAEAAIEISRSTDIHRFDCLKRGCTVGVTGFDVVPLHLPHPHTNRNVLDHSGTIFTKFSPCVLQDLLI